jgi:hypothetical protein
MLNDALCKSLVSDECVLFQIPRRYAEFAAAFLSINDNEPNERIGQLMSRLQHEVDSFINRLAREFPNKKQQLIFFINNYDMIVATISVSIFI